MDETLSWNAHVKSLVSKIGKRLGMFNRIKKDITMNTAEILYRSFILPIADYCSAVWNCCGKGNTDLIEKLQRRAARIIMKSPSSDEAVEKLRYDTLESRSRREKHIFKLARNASGQVPQFFKNYISRLIEM